MDEQEYLVDGVILPPQEEESKPCDCDCVVPGTLTVTISSVGATKRDRRALRDCPWAGTIASYK